MYSLRSGTRSMSLWMKLAIFVTCPRYPLRKCKCDGGLSMRQAEDSIVAVDSLKNWINLASVKSALRIACDENYADWTMIRSTNVCSMLFHSYYKKSSKRTTCKLFCAISCTTKKLSNFNNKQKISTIFKRAYPNGRIAYRYVVIIVVVAVSCESLGNDFVSSLSIIPPIDKLNTFSGPSKSISNSFNEFSSSSLLRPCFLQAKNVSRN